MVEGVEVFLILLITGVGSQHGPCSIKQGGFVVVVVVVVVVVCSGCSMHVVQGVRV
jgi:hypothetical protein